jgi:hypothetical protein
MTKLAIIGAALCGLASTSAQAADYLPKKFWGKWCVTESATGGGSPRFWVYSRSQAECDAADIPQHWRDEAMTLSGNRMDKDCRAFKRTIWYEENRLVYFITYRCDRGLVTAKFDLDRDGGLTVQRMQGDPKEEDND